MPQRGQGSPSPGITTYFFRDRLPFNSLAATVLRTVLPHRKRQAPAICGDLARRINSPSCRSCCGSRRNMGKFLLIAAVTHHTAKWVGAPYHFVTDMGATFWIAVAVLLVIGFCCFGYCVGGCDRRTAAGKSSPVCITKPGRRSAGHSFRFELLTSRNRL